jgi:glutaredoxin
VNLTLLSKPGCHLCDDLRALLEELRPEYEFALEEIDITGDEALYARYRFDIPVLLKDGNEVARGRIGDRELVGLLNA